MVAVCSAERLDSDDATAGFAGGSAALGLELTSDIEPPAWSRASCKSSAACFITVRSSGAGISASDFVSGKNVAAGFSGAAAAGVAGVRVAGVIEPSPIIVDLRGFAGLSASAAGVVVFDGLAPGAVVVAPAARLPVSPPPASYALVASPRDSTSASITLRDASSILMNFTPMPAGRTSGCVSLSRFQTTRPTP